MGITSGINKLGYKLTGNKRFQGLPFKFLYLNKQPFSTGEFAFLDIGCGNHSATYTKWFFPNCKYYGLDLDRNYNNDENDFKVMEAFYELDLEKSDLKSVPDAMFDYINLSHVIEHIKNHEILLERLLPKLRDGGIIFIEYPGYRSTKLPSMYHSLNFFDDPTHVHIHSHRDLANVLMKNDMQIIKMGTRRDIFEIISIPRKLLAALRNRWRVEGIVFWSLLGFADFIIAKRNQH
jgi:SAM-dependent methyltransferase